MRPGQLERYDYEYRRNGTVNLFVLLDVHRPWRKVKLTERRAAKDYAKCMRDLVDIHYPDAETIRVVQDNLSTHSAGALYDLETRFLFSTIGLNAEAMKPGSDPCQGLRWALSISSRQMIAPLGSSFIERTVYIGPTFG